MKTISPANIPNLIKRFWQTICSNLTQAWQAVKPGPFAVLGAARGMLVLAGFIYLVFALDAAQGPLEPMLLSLVLLIVGGLLLLWLGQGIAWAIGLLARIPWTFRWSLAAGTAMLFLSLMWVAPMGTILSTALLLGCAALIGAGASVLLRGGLRQLTMVQRAVTIAGSSVGLVVLTAALVWYFWPGPPAGEVVNAARLSTPVVPLDLPDPSQPGTYEVQTLTYGSGSDSHRPEFGSGVQIQTQPVDGSRLLKGSWEGFSGQMRNQWWGFGPDRLPINGRVWFPAGEGPFPLVLIVHGNHSMSDFSDSGYAYLGELMASRGFIFVSVDENFINGGLPDLFTGFSGENDARAWMLLEHLRTWKEWNDDTANAFYHKVDLDRIALIGHSRGGEAAAVAALFNRLPYYPDDANQIFNYHFNIRAVAAIAPIDGQYQPSSKPVELEDIQYFVLHGSHDGDAYTFFGINQYERIQYTPGSDGFKSALYIYRANHGQFNTTWGSNDHGSILSTGFLNRRVLLAKAQQEQVARVYLSAFLEASLHDQRGYLPLLADARVGSAWLPDTVYINRFDQSGDRRIATYEEDVDLSTGSLPGSQIRGENLKLWREQRIQAKGGSQYNAGVYLGWNEEAPASYTISLPPDLPAFSPASALLFNLADALQDPDPGPNQPKTTEKNNALRQPIDLTIELVDSQGNSAGLPLNRYLLVQPQLPGGVFKASFLERRRTSEPVLQSYSIALQDFSDANPALDLSQVRAIRFVFNLTPRGSVILDGVGIRP